MSCLCEGSAEITIPKFRKGFQPSTPPMWRSPQLGHAQVRALINRTLPDIMLCHWIARFASIRYSVLSSSEVLSRSDRTNFLLLSCSPYHSIVFRRQKFQLEHPLLLFTHTALPQELPRAVDFKDVEDNPHSRCLICWLANRTQVQTSPRSNWRTDD
jgi:hypothetical protein